MFFNHLQNLSVFLRRKSMELLNLHPSLICGALDRFVYLLDGHLVLPDRNHDLSISLLILLKDIVELNLLELFQ